MAMKTSKGRLIGDTFFLTAGPIAAALLGLQRPEYMWVIILSFVAARVGIEMIVASRRKALDGSTKVEAQQPRQVAHV